MAYDIPEVNHAPTVHEQLAGSNLCAARVLEEFEGFRMNMIRVWQRIEICFALAALAIVVAFLVYAFKLHSDGAAAWVQAIGSIAAIIGAFEVGRRQADAARKQAIDMNAATHRRQREAIAAIVQGSWDQAHSVAQLMVKMPPQLFYQTLLMSVHSIPESRAGLARIPLHELGSYEAVVAITGLLGNLKVIEESIGTINVAGGRLRPDEYAECTRRVVAADAVAAFHARKALMALEIAIREPSDLGLP